MNKVGQLLTSARAIALLALFVALGGTAYAGLKLGKNVVKGRNIAPNAVTSPKVKNGSLVAGDFKPGQLPAGARGEQGAKGDKGDKGDTGDKGEAGSVGPRGPSVVARARGSADLAVPSGTVDATYTLEGNTWTQAANESDVLFGVIRAGLSGTCGQAQNEGLTVKILVDGTPLLSQPFASQGGATDTLTGVVNNFFPALFEPGTATARTLSVKVTNTCPAGVTGTIHSVKLNVGGST
jgi:hypothetical protein